jgi:carboxylate-amine ligase
VTIRTAASYPAPAARKPMPELPLDDHATVGPRADELRVADLRARFDAHDTFTIGLEEELMLLDPETLDLVPAAGKLLDGGPLAGDQRFKRELPAAQLEIAAPPAATVAEAAAHLAAARADLLAAADGRVTFAAAGVHPFAAEEGELSRGEAYDRTRAEYGPVARRQLVSGLHVHVAVPGADAAMAVYNGLRSLLPELAALGANGAFYGGRDSGLASVRPLISGLLPRQGVPPALSSLEAYARALAWGAAAGALPSAAQWWWELRLHPVHGTLEVRVPDAQTTVADAAAVAAVVHALVATLADGALAPVVADTWRIEENRWSACRHGLDGVMADLRTGERTPTRERLHALLDAIAGAGETLGCAAELRDARALVERNGALRQRAVAAAAGDADPARAVAADLAGRFAQL